MICAYATLMKLEDYGFNEKSCVSDYHEFQWLKSRNLCNVILDIYKKLTERKCNLNAVDYYLFPKQLMLLLCAIPHIFHHLQVFQSDVYTYKYEYFCQYFDVNACCQTDGHPQIKRNCERCKKEEQMK